MKKSLQPIVVKLQIKELDLNDIPISSKLVVIGKPETGKTHLITSILAAKRHIYPVFVIISGTEDSNSFYKTFFPDLFIYEQYDREIIKRFIKRQKIAKKYLAASQAVILLDDCTDDPRIFNDPLMLGMYKNGRHWNMLFILSLQYSMDIRPTIRTNIDGTFILKEPNRKNREKIWENYASIIPTFRMFCDIMDQLTENYTALFIKNRGQSNELQDNIFYYKAPQIINTGQYGSDEFWNFNKIRFNTEYNPDFED